jgi:hypothetical protein
MQLTKQVTAFLENKPGRLANICSALGREKVNIQALTVMDSKEHSVLRLVPDDIARARAVLAALGTPYQETEVMVVEMDNRPGSLAKVCERLAAEHVNIDYAYCSSGAGNGRALGVFKVSNVARATQALASGRGGGNRRQPSRRPAFAR